MGSNDQLRTSSSKNEKDTHDIVLYFQREMEMKDDIIARLNEELVKRETQLKFEVERIRKKADSDVNEIKTSSRELIDDLKTRLGEVELELSQVESFRREKDFHQATKKQLEETKLQLETELVSTLDRLERKSLEEKAQIYKDLDQQKILFRELAMREARESMGHDMKMLVKDHERIQEEIKFHRQMADDLVSEKKSLAMSLSSTRRELEIFKDSEQDYVRQGLVRSKEIKALRERVEQLEKQQIVNIERFKARTKELQTSVYKELEDATLDAAGLRRLIKIKNKELRTMKSLSATILSQRNEIEQFFLESLHEVREKIKKDRQRTQRTKTGDKSSRLTSRGPLTAQGNKIIAGFPQIKGVSSTLLDSRDTSDIPLDELDKVTIRDLNWEDKELILRVLFAKMNGQQQMVDSAITQSKSKSQVKNKATFVSEGTDLPEDEADAYQKNFEIYNDDGDDDDEG